MRNAAVMQSCFRDSLGAGIGAREPGHRRAAFLFEFQGVPDGLLQRAAELLAVEVVLEHIHGGPLLPDVVQEKQMLWILRPVDCFQADRWTAATQSLAEAGLVCIRNLLPHADQRPPRSCRKVSAAARTRP
eukprot:9498186-Pyramimonas_sp.AAC.1